MILTTEILVTILMTAAAVVGWMAIPSARGAVRNYIVTGSFLRGVPRNDNLNGASSSSPPQYLKIDCLASGDIALTRYPVDGDVITEPRLDIEVSGTDIRITEHLTPSPDGNFTATFILNMVGHDYWHIRYLNPDTGHLAVFSLHNRPGITTTKTLST